MKRLVIFSDGTGNSSAKAQKTNVWRMFQALDQTKPDQLAKYDNGVGTSSNKYLAALGGAFGFGLKRNVIDLYKFVCRNYEGGDEIYGFGFSRGAFTIRVIAGFIATEGLVKARSEAELHAMALVAYRQYRSKRFKSKSPLVWIARGLRDLVLWPLTHAERKRHQQHRLPPNSVPIKFLGLWDTVSAYGMPIDELKWGLSMLVWPMVSVDQQLFPCVERACHALALDEQRETFHPALFDEELEARLVQNRKVPPGRLHQVWFAGVHSNVGGGYPEDKLSLVSLDWMMSQAFAVGLRFNPASMPQFADEKSAYARLYDSRAGVMAYYRYSPRKVECDPDGRPILPIVHGSVVMRMAKGSDSYAPISLPEEFDVLAPDGQLLPMRGFKSTAANVPVRGSLPQSTTAASHVVAQRKVALQDAILKMGQPHSELVSQVRDTIWWRRVTYFACLAATLLLVAFPFASTLYLRAVAAVVDVLGEFGVVLRVQAAKGISLADELWHGDVNALLVLVQPMVPHYFDRWLNALADRPLEMTVFLVLVAIPFALGNFLGSRIHDRAWFAWHPDRCEDYLDWLAQFDSRISKLAAVFALAAGIFLAASIICNWSANALVAIAATFAVLVVVLLWRLAMARRLKKIRDSQRGGALTLPTPPMLQLARCLRHSRPLVRVYTQLTEKIIPIMVALLVLLAGLCLLHHIVYQAASRAGLFCSGSSNPTEPSAQSSDDKQPDNKDSVNATFKTREICWASGFKVKGGSTYEVTLETPGDWFDQTDRTDVAGFSADSPVHLIASPLKRLWSADWFVPVVRVGRIGSDEFVMSPTQPRGKPYEPYVGKPVANFSPMNAEDVERIVATQRHDDAPTSGTLTFTAPHDGELFVYVNDAVLMLPSTTGLFYGNNFGSGTLKIHRLKDVPKPR